MSGEADSGDLVADLVRLLADDRADAAAGSRRKERWWRQQAEEGATFAGVLVDLAEAGRPVVVSGAGGRRHRGLIRAVADDCCAVRTASGDALLGYGGITAVRPADGWDGAAGGDRPVALDTTFVECLALLVADRPPVQLVTVDGSALRGELRAVGLDVVTLRLDGEPGAIGYVPMSAVAEVTISG